MVNVYVANIAELPKPSACPELVGSLSAERQQKLGKLLQVEKQKQCLGAGLLLQKVLSYHGVPADSVRLGKNGKPEVDGIYFNLSHSGELVACAVSDKPVGCDIEKRKEAPAHLAERFFCKREREYLAPFTGKEYDHEFFRLWTMKESYVKMTGEGLSLPMDSFEIVCLDPVTVFREGHIQNCFIKEYTVSGYQVTVCAKEAEFAEIFWENM